MRFGRTTCTALHRTTEERRCSSGVYGDDEGDVDDDESRTTIIRNDTVRLQTEIVQTRPYKDNKVLCTPARLERRPGPKGINQSSMTSLAPVPYSRSRIVWSSLRQWLEP